MPDPEQQKKRRFRIPSRVNADGRVGKNVPIFKKRCTVLVLQKCVLKVRVRICIIKFLDSDLHGKNADPHFFGGSPVHFLRMG